MGVFLGVMVTSTVSVVRHFIEHLVSTHRTMNDNSCFVIITPCVEHASMVRFDVCFPACTTEFMSAFSLNLVTRKQGIRWRNIGFQHSPSTQVRVPYRRFHTFHTDRTVLPVSRLHFFKLSNRLEIMPSSSKLFNHA